MDLSLTTCVLTSATDLDHASWTRSQIDSILTYMLTLVPECFIKFYFMIDYMDKILFKFTQVIVKNCLLT